MMGTIYYIVVHCSATREGRTLPLQALEADHRQRGFHGIGYHYYIRRDGTVHSTRPLNQPGAHVKGYNRHSIGICYEGGLDAEGHPKDTRTPEQRSALHLLAAQLMKRFPKARLCGHRDLSPDRNGDGTVTPDEWLKECPCFEVAKEL